MNIETEFYDGGIDSVVQKEFIAKLIGLANLNENEMLAITKCVMGDEYKSSFAKEIGVAPSTADKTISRAINKLQRAFIGNRTKLVGKDPSMIFYESRDGYQNRIKAEKEKHVQEKMVVDEHGTKHWYRGNLLHREDGPAVVQRNGGQAWFYYGNRHREDGPAIEYADGSKEWWLHGQLHRQIGFAVEHTNGKREKWLYNNKIYEEQL